MKEIQFLSTALFFIFAFTLTVVSMDKKVIPVKAVEAILVGEAVQAQPIHSTVAVGRNYSEFTSVRILDKQESSNCYCNCCGYIYEKNSTKTIHTEEVK